MKNRIGLHYFSDVDHYQVKDLGLWLPEFIQMKIGWLVLQSPTSYAIPEEFIKGLLNKGINPVIQFNIQVNCGLKPDDLRVILSAYARWGVKYVIFYNMPNLKTSWFEGTWSQADLVDRFLDRYIPFAEMALSLGMIPVFPPLHPGGDYWDTTFLKKTLLLLQQRKNISMLSGLHIAVSGQTFNKPLDWGKGGSAVWKPAKPYEPVSSEDAQDHMGMQTWEWYTEIVQQLTKSTPKILLFWLGTNNHLEIDSLDANLSLERLIDMAGSDPTLQDSEQRGLIFGENVIACLLWLLPASVLQASGDESKLQVKELPNPGLFSQLKTHLIKASRSSDELPVARKVADWIYPIDHYLLLPVYEWGVPEHVLERVRPIIREFMPTVGFSVSEASLARKVTIWNENSHFTESDINLLKRSGCEVDEKLVDGINIAPTF